MKDRPQLKADKRTILGKKVKRLRAQGALPAHVYGKGRESIALTIAQDAFDAVYAAAGETGIIDLAVGEETIPVLVHGLQYDPVSDKLLHVDFYQVDLTKKIVVRVPIHVVGEPPAVRDKIGILDQPMADIEVEALPTELPEKIDVDVSDLAEIDATKLVSDLQVPHGVSVSAEPTEVVVKVGPLISAEMQKQVEEEEAAAEAAKAEGAGEEKKEGEEEKKEEGGKEEEGEKKEEKKEKPADKKEESKK